MQTLYSSSLYCKIMRNIFPMEAINLSLKSIDLFKFVYVNKGFL